MKVCRKCSVEKPLSYEYFSKNKGAKDGFNTWCRKCINEYQKTKKKENRNHKYSVIETWRNSIKGVYGIFENGICLYVGESKQLNQRICRHKSSIKNPEKAGTQTSLYYNLQTHNHLIFGVIEECENHKEREQHFIDIYKPIYNNI